MINKVTLLGHITKKEFKELRNGGNICMFTLVTSRIYIDAKGQKIRDPTYHNVNFFNKLAEVTNKYVNIADVIFIEGEIVNRKIDENGVNRVIHSITGQEFKIVSKDKDKSMLYKEPNGNVVD